MLAWKSLRWTWIGDGTQAEFIGVADDLAALHAAARHPDGEAVRDCGRGPSAPPGAAIRRRDCGQIRRPRSPACESSRPRAFRSVEQPGHAFVGLGGARQVILVALRYGRPSRRHSCHCHSTPARSARRVPPGGRAREAAAAEVGALTGSSSPYSFLVASDSLLTSVASGADICMRKASSYDSMRAASSES